jgi:P27 family predicted phage terminase small subunit
MSTYRGQGAKAKPTRLKLLAGTYRADRANPDEPTPAVLEKLPSCPSHITGEARKAWRNMGRKLLAMGVLTDVDLPALEAYCTVYARWREAETKLTETGLVIYKDGWIQQSPYMGIVNECLRQLRAYMAEFGITPSSRVRVKAVHKGPDQDSPDTYFFGKN